MRIRGFSILELLIAIAIFFLLVGSFLATTSTFFSQISQSISRGNALNVAKETIELYMAQPLPNGVYEITRELDGVRYHVTITIRDEEELRSLNLRRIEVSVRGGSMRSPLSLESYI